MLSPLTFSILYLSISYFRIPLALRFPTTLRPRKIFFSNGHEIILKLVITNLYVTNSLWIAAGITTDVTHYKLDLVYADMLWIEKRSTMYIIRRPHFVAILAISTYMRPYKNDRESISSFLNYIFCFEFVIFITGQFEFICFLFLQRV